VIKEAIDAPVLFASSTLTVKAAAWIKIPAAEVARFWRFGQTLASSGYVVGCAIFLAAADTRSSKWFASVEDPKKPEITYTPSATL